MRSTARPTAVVSRVGAEKCTAVVAFVREMLAEYLWSHGAVLEAALWKDRHVDADDVSNAAPDDLALECIERRYVIRGQRSERDRLGHVNDRRTRIGAEPDEAMPSSGRIG